MNKTELLEAMASGAVVITPNNRLAAELLELYFQNQTEPVVEKPQCFPWQSFLNKLYEALNTERPMLLTPGQLRFLWRQIVNISAGPGLLDEVQEAFRRCLCWRISLDDPLFSHTDAARQFQLWACQLQEELTRLFALTEDHVAGYFLEHPPVLPPCLIWYCFDEYTPVQKAFQQMAEASGTSVRHYDLARQHTGVSLYAAADSEDEILQTGLWLKKRLAAGDHRIAVVIPDLQKQAARIKRSLQNQMPHENFNISLGEKLSETPLAAHALVWLKLNERVLSHEEARLLLYSPFIGGSVREFEKRAEFLQNSSVLKENSISMAHFLNALDTAAPHLAGILKSMLPYPPQALTGEWVDCFAARLKNAGFPGECSFHSEAYQCYQRFLMLFEEFRGLALIKAQMSAKEALSTFETLAATTVFQAKKPAARVQILGILEALGGEYDSLWVSGMTSECLPAKTRLSAFIPGLLQRDNRMPHACPVREWQLADSAIRRFKNSAPEVIFSFPELSEDKPELPSPLLHDLPAYSPVKSEDALELPQLEYYEEDFLHPAERPVRGGTALLASQAKCPFKAFAAYRLYLKPGVVKEECLNALERGRIVHKILEIIWLKLRDQRTLLTLSDRELEEHIHQAVFEALQAGSGSGPLPRLFQDVEFIRQKQLAQAVLEWEKQRPFFEVEALEKTFHLHLAGIDFKLRIDRLDRHEDGEKTVIDYKTSLPENMPWKEERPKEPQLLMYALLDEKINHLTFIGLKEGGVSVKGVDEESLDAHFRENWKTLLSGLAEEFMQGHCLPAPQNANICRQCDFQGLCRFQAVE